MLLAYLDESESDGHFYIGSLVVHESNAQALTHALDDIVMAAAAAYSQIEADMELHAHELVNAKKRWAPMKRMLRARIGIFEAVIRAIVDNHAQLIFEGIHLERCRARYPEPEAPHRLALTWTSERINEFAAQQDELALMIADEVDHRDEHRRNLWVAQRHGTWGYKAQRIDRIVDTLHFTPSHTSRLLQASDVATYLYRRWRAHEETDDRARREWERLFRLLQPNIARARLWPG